MMEKWKRKQRGMEDWNTGIMGIKKWKKMFSHHSIFPMFQYSDSFIIPLFQYSYFERRLSWKI
jgi:hypothetical protein